MSLFEPLYERSIAHIARLVTKMPGGSVIFAVGASSVRTVVEPVLAEHLRAMANAGAAHLQLVLDPITVESIEVVGEIVRDLSDSSTTK